ncbi:MAG: GNAT family N-acetyltransferase [Bacteroidota bacterium]
MRPGADVLTNPQYTIRKLREEDVPRLENILRLTGVFTEEEISVALELMDIFLHDPGQDDYDIYSSLDENGEAQGYVCIGPTPMTNGTYDLYWIAVDPRRHHRGIGKQLQLFTEELVRSRGGRLIIAETSSMPKYENTRKFYLSLNYTEAARIKDYYKIGDDLVVYGKYVSQFKEHSI